MQAVPGPSIFISYRRDDAAGDAGRLADHLNRRFGSAHVFLDIDAIAPGTDFVRVLESSLQQTAVTLVIIGPRWTSLRDKSGNRRLDDPADFVRLEVEAALKRGIPVVPVLVQGASLPRADELPPSLAGLVTRQAATLDHAEFHADAERLADRLAATIGGAQRPSTTAMRRWWPAAAAVLAVTVAIGAYLWQRTGDDATTTPPDAELRTPDAADTSRVDALLAEAAVQRRREQFPDALTTLARARDLAPESPAVRQAQEDLAMYWMRNIRVEQGQSTFAEALKPALAVVDGALPAATGTQRADLLAHSGWATFLLWREGNRRLDPTEWYREALAIDPVNPYANAMLAHWILFRVDEDVPRAVSLFATALKSGRATEAVRTLQISAYGNASALQADAEAMRVVNGMRQEDQRLNAAQVSELWRPYYSGISRSGANGRQILLTALPPDEHIATLHWAFDEYVAIDESRRRILRFYEALLHADAGRPDQAAAELRGLENELVNTPGSMRDAVTEALRPLASRQ